MQTTDFSSYVGHFSPCEAKNDLHKKGKYHAAAGESCLLRKSYSCHLVIKRSTFTVEYVIGGPNANLTGPSTRGIMRYCVKHIPHSVCGSPPAPLETHQRRDHRSQPARSLSRRRHWDAYALEASFVALARFANHDTIGRSRRFFPLSRSDMLFEPTD